MLLAVPLFRTPAQDSVIVLLLTTFLLPAEVQELSR